MGVEKRTYSFRLSDELVEKIKQSAEEQNRSLSNMVETILKEYIEKPEK